MTAINQALRAFLLFATLVGIALFVMSRTTGPAGIWALIAGLGLVSVVWAFVAVPDDPGSLTWPIVAISGPLRLALELAILLAGGAGFYLSGLLVTALFLALLTLLHFALSAARLRRLLGQKTRA